MKKLLFFLSILILLTSTVSSQISVIEKTEISQVIVVELENPLEYIIKINNSDSQNTFRIFSLAGFDIDPEEIEIAQGETRSVRIKAYASKNRLETTRGEFVFNYLIESDSDSFEDQLRVEMVEFKDLFEFTIDDINPQSKEIQISLENKEKINLENLNVKIDSPFFEEEKTITLTPYGKSIFSIELKQEQLDKLIAGNYLSNFEIEFEDIKAEFETPFNYLEKEGLTVSETSKGFIVREKIIEKTNTGNTAITAKTSKKINILNRLFTTLSEKPISSEKSGFFVTYNWEKELSPGESLLIKLKTNYTFPFIIILVILVIVIAVKVFIESSLKIKKHVSLVKTKGEEFAMRVRLNVKAKKTLKDVQIIDKIPQMTKLYDKFGIKPNKIDPKNRKLIWNIKHLNAGEERIFSYIIYSKIKLMGKFNLPSAIASYEINGKKMQTSSNTTSLATETSERPKMAEDFI